MASIEICTFLLIRIVFLLNDVHVRSDTWSWCVHSPHAFGCAVCGFHCSCSFIVEETKKFSRFS